jgi:hypothetical protein
MNSGKMTEEQIQARRKAVLQRIAQNRLKDIKDIPVKGYLDENLCDAVNTAHAHAYDWDDPVFNDYHFDPLLHKIGTLFATLVKEAIREILTDSEARHD